MRDLSMLVSIVGVNVKERIPNMELQKIDVASKQAARGTIDVYHCLPAAQGFQLCR